MKNLIVLLIVLVSVPAIAANKYVRSDATGSANGSDWTNAYTNLPSTLTRGDIYYIADGSYGDYAFDTNESSSTYITIKKATAADHGTATGWDSRYGDGQASFSTLYFDTSYWVFDGQIRNEDNWEDYGAYGFSVLKVYSNTSRGACPDYITVRYAEIGGAFSQNYASNIPMECFYWGGFYGDLCTHWQIDHNLIHNCQYAGQMAGNTDMTWEYNQISNGWGKESIRGQNTATNVIMRYNFFHDVCRNDCNGCTGGCTAVVALFANSGQTPNFDGFEFYGNVIWNDSGNSTWSCCGNVMAEADAKAYNNTIVDEADGVGGFRFFSTSGSEVVNNITYYTGDRTAPCESETCTSNSNYTSSPPFISAGTGNFRLSGSLAGTSLGATYNTDLDGNTRGGDSTWDRGAYEYGGSGPPADETPPVLSAGSPSGTIQCTDPSGTISVTESVTSNENATVKYDGSDVAFDSMSGTYTVTGGTTHSRSVSRACDGSYVTYSRGMDSSGNKGASSLQTSYTIAAWAASDQQTTLAADYSFDVRSDPVKFVHDGDDWVGKGSGNPLRIATRWDVSSIAANYEISKVEVRWYVASKTGSPGTLYVNRYGSSHGETNPETDSAADSYTNCAGTNYATSTEPAAASWTEWIDLGATAITDLEWCRDNAQTTWAVGLKTAAGVEGGEVAAYLVIYEDTHANDAELKITYTYNETPPGVTHIGIERPNSIVVNSGTKTLTWTIE